MLLEGDKFEQDINKISKIVESVEKDYSEHRMKAKFQSDYNVRNEVKQRQSNYTEALKKL